MIALSCSKLSKSFGIVSVFRDISFSINHYEKVGLIGLNGTGKTTLFKILTGELSQDEGEIFKARDFSLGYLRQDNELKENATVLEEVMEVFDHLRQKEIHLRHLEETIAEKSGQASPDLDEIMGDYSKKLEDFEAEGGYSYKSEARGVLVGLGFKKEEFHQPVNQLSGGQKTRLSLGKLLLEKPEILLLDEPTNHLDIEAIQWLETFLKNYRGTLLLISHDRYFLDQVISRTFEMEHQSLRIYNGNYSVFMKKKQAALEQQRTQYLQNQKVIEKEKDKIRRLRQHGTEKLMNRAKSKEKQFEKMDRAAAPEFERDNAKIRFTPQKESGQDVLFVENLSKSFDGETLFQNVNFDVYKGDKIALIGPNGIGKTTLMKMILGLADIDRGAVTFGHHVETGYYDQEMKDLDPKNTVMEEIWNHHSHLTHTQVRTYLGSFLFVGDEVFKGVDVLSGGERARVSLLKLILSKSNLIFLDEPTNHLDIQSKEVLEDALRSYEGTLFFISHDRYFINRVANRVFDLHHRGVDQFLGNYDYYLEKKREEAIEAEMQNAMEKTPQRTETQRKQQQKRDRQQQRVLKKLKQDYAALEEKILHTEEQIEALDEELCKEEVYSVPARTKKIQKEKTEKEHALESLYEKLSALEDSLSEE